MFSSLDPFRPFPIIAVNVQRSMSEYSNKLLDLKNLREIAFSEESAAIPSDSWWNEKKQTIRTLRSSFQSLYKKFQDLSRSILVDEALKGEIGGYLGHITRELELIKEQEKRGEFKQLTEMLSQVKANSRKIVSERYLDKGKRYTFKENDLYILYGPELLYLTGSECDSLGQDQELLFFISSMGQPVPLKYTLENEVLLLKPFQMNESIMQSDLMIDNKIGKSATNFPTPNSPKEKENFYWKVRTVEGLYEALYHIECQTGAYLANPQFVKAMVAKSFRHYQSKEQLMGLISRSPSGSIGFCKSHFPGLIYCCGKFQGGKTLCQLVDQALPKISSLAEIPGLLLRLDEIQKNGRAQIPILRPSPLRPNTQEFLNRMFPDTIERSIDEPAAK